MQVLLVEDDHQLADAVGRGLEENGMVVEAWSDGASAAQRILDVSPDLVVLDVMLPGRDGFQVAAEVRRRGFQAPILMLTGRDAIGDRVRGLETGADDYLVKPFAFDELVARLRALDRRHRPTPEGALFLGAVELDPGGRTVQVGGDQLQLTAKEFDVLHYLMINANLVVSREQILDGVWGLDSDPPADSNAVEVYIARIRKKLDNSGVSGVVTTVRGAGYRFDTGRR
jgi:DNA-binding response OmpR family regulator